MSPRLFTGLLATQSDERLAELVAAGHERAFDAVVRRYRRSLLRYCTHIGFSDGHAEDIVQQALLQAWVALRRGVVVRDLRPWLYRIVHNAAINALRRAPQGPVLPADEERTGEHAPPVEVDFERRMALHETLSGVAALPSMQRDAILLSAVDGRSYDEVASELGITEGAVRGLLYRARAALRDAVAALTPTPLIAWVCGAATKAAPAGSRVAEFSASGAGTAESTGLLVKGAVIAISTAVIVTGAAEVRAHDHGAHRAAHAPGTTASVQAQARSASGSVHSGTLALAAHSHKTRTRATSSSLSTASSTSAGDVITIVPTSSSSPRSSAPRLSAGAKPAPNAGSGQGPAASHPSHSSAPAILASTVSSGNESSTKSGSSQTSPGSGQTSSGGSGTGGSGSGSGTSGGGGSTGEGSKPEEKPAGSEKDDGGSEKDDGGSEKDDGGTGGTTEHEAEKTTEKSDDRGTGDDGSHEAEKTGTSGSGSTEKEPEPKTEEKPDS